MSGLGNYKYKGAALSTVIKGINSSTSTTIKTAITNGFNLVASDIVGSAVPFTGVDEKPAAINYKYNGTDISTYAIAKYTKDAGTITIPAWCNKIRYALCGAGGAGGAATANTEYQTTYHYQGHYYDGWYHYYNYHGSYATQNNNAQSGAGGGAGGFIYSTNTVTPGSTIVLAIGAGASGKDGGNTTLTVGSSTYTANGGKKAATTTKGEGGIGSENDGNDGSANVSVTSGDGGTQTKNNASNSYGKGGRGYPTTSPYKVSTTSSSTTAGAAGTSGFAIIYFIE